MRVVGGENLNNQADITSGADHISAADTTVFPVYINKKGRLVHGVREVVGQKILSKVRVLRSRINSSKIVK